MSMPYTCRCSPGERLMVCDLSDASGVQDTVAVFRHIASGESCLEDGWGILVDARERQATPAMDDLDLLVETLGDLREVVASQIALLVGWWADFGMARLLETRCSSMGVPLRVFMHESEARAWLEGEGDPAESSASERSMESDIAEMLGLAKGILSDGVVTENEARTLRGWMDTHPDVVEGWPGNVLAQRLLAIFEDGVVTVEEREDLARLLQGLLGGGIEVLGGGATALPLDDPHPTVEVQDHVFVLVGRFAYGSRQACEDEIRRLGGVCEDALGEGTDFLVIGTFGSRDWIQSNWSREIASAVEHRRRHGRPYIIGEDHWAAGL